MLGPAFLAFTLLIAGACPALAQDAAAGEKDSGVPRLPSDRTRCQDRGWPRA